MSIRWEELKTAEKRWQLDHYVKEQIFQNCIRGRRATRFSWRFIAIPAAYIGVAAAMILVMLFLWPHFRRPQEQEIIIGGAASDPFVDDPVPEQPLEQPTPDDMPQTPAEENDGQTDEPKKQASEQSSDSMVKRVETNDYSELVRITKGDLEDLFDYEIYYYQIENFYIDVDGETMELRQALKKDPKVLDSLYAEWKQDHGTKYIYYDGGTIEYPYETYTAIKMNRIRVSVSPEDYSINRNNVDRSLILCSSKANLSEVDDRIMLGVTDYGYDSEEEQCYKSTVETEPYPPSFVLKKMVGLPLYSAASAVLRRRGPIPLKERN